MIIFVVLYIAVPVIPDLIGNLHFTVAGGAVKHLLARFTEKAATRCDRLSESVSSCNNVSSLRGARSIVVSYNQSLSHNSKNPYPRHN